MRKTKEELRAIREKTMDSLLFVATHRGNEHLREKILWWKAGVNGQIPGEIRHIYRSILRDSTNPK